MLFSFTLYSDSLWIRHTFSTIIMTSKLTSTSHRRDFSMVSLYIFSIFLHHCSMVAPSTSRLNALPYLFNSIPPRFLPWFHRASPLHQSNDWHFLLWSLWYTLSLFGRLTSMWTVYISTVSQPYSWSKGKSCHRRVSRLIRLVHYWRHVSLNLLVLMSSGPSLFS